MAPPGRPRQRPPMALCPFCCKSCCRRCSPEKVLPSSGEHSQRVGEVERSAIASAHPYCRSFQLFWGPPPARRGPFGPWRVVCAKSLAAGCRRVAQTSDHPTAARGAGHQMHVPNRSRGRLPAPVPCARCSRQVKNVGAAEAAMAKVPLAGDTDSDCLR